MAVAHVANTRSALATAVLNEISNNGQMTLRTSGGVEVATLTLPTTSGTVSGPTITFGTFADDTSATGGLVAHIRMETSGGVEVYRFNASGDGVTLSSLNIGALDTVQCGSMTYTAPA